MFLGQVLNWITCILLYRIIIELKNIFLGGLDMNKFEDEND